MLAPVRSHLSLRLATPADAPALRDLIAASFRAAGRAAYAPAAIEALLRIGEVRLDETLLLDGNLWVAEAEGVLVGCAGWTWRDGGVGVRRPGRDAAEVRTVYVAPDSFGRGIGARLLARVEEEVRRSGYDRAELLSTLNAVPFYAAHGWRVLREVDQDLGDGLRGPGMRMIKMLSAPRLAIV